MKICWDNLENIILTKNGKFRDVKRKITYNYIVGCKNCGEPFLTFSHGRFCCVSCANSGENNHMYSKIGHKNHFFGKCHTEKAKKKMSEANLNKQQGKDNPFWNGGYYRKGIPRYDTYAHQIEWCEEVRRNKEDGNVLEVRCTYCGKWYIPKLWTVRCRIKATNGKITGEGHLYCSDKCKKVCPTYSKSPNQLMKEDAIKAGRLDWLELNREVQSELRKIVLERDKYQCIKCSSVGPLHCHHIYPVSTNPLESADVDDCITLCIDCHKESHQKDGCKYNQLRTEIC
jgi:hypothetical protein